MARTELTPVGRRVQWAINRKYGGPKHNKDAASDMGMSQKRLSTLLRHRMPSGEELIAISETLHVSSDYILRERDDGGRPLTETEIREACRRLLKEAPECIVEVLTKMMLRIYYHME